MMDSEGTCPKNIFTKTKRTEKEIESYLAKPKFKDSLSKKKKVVDEGDLPPENDESIEDIEALALLAMKDQDEDGEDV